MPTAPVFKKTYEQYVAQIAALDLAKAAETAGGQWIDGRLKIDLFNTAYWISPEGIYDASGQQAELSVVVILSKYLLSGCAPQCDDCRLTAYKDFKDAAPLVHFFSNTIQGEIEKVFSGRAQSLEKACAEMGGQPYEAELAYAIRYRFCGLPAVPVYLLFNDAEEGFAAQCILLFERSAEFYLDMESLAMLGGILVRGMAAFGR
jgi:hypothetical protein